MTVLIASVKFQPLTEGDFLPLWCGVDPERDALPEVGTSDLQPLGVGEQEWPFKLASKQHLNTNPCQQYMEFPSGLLFKHYHGPILPKLSVKIGTGVSNMELNFCVS